MAAKAKKRSRAKRKPYKVFLVGLFAALSVVAALSFYSYVSHSNQVIIQPLFEEAYSKSSGLNDGIAEIDHAIYTSLYEHGIPPKDIHFVAIKPRHQGGFYWDYTELLVTVPQGRSLRDLAREMSLNLSVLCQSAGCKAEFQHRDEIVFRVFAKGFFTHKINLQVERGKPPRPAGLPRLALIIDDLGYDPDAASLFGEIGLPLTMSILPATPHAKAIAQAARKQGCEIMLHLPMEPKNYPRLRPGPGALLTKMTAPEIRDTLRRHLADVPGIAGVNNHMGSCFTERTEQMDVVLRELKRRRLFFVDSRTTRDTVGYRLGRQLGVPVAQRSVFLDNNLSQKAIRFQMERLLRIAKQDGHALGIGHPHRDTFEVLQDYVERMKGEVEVVPASQLVK
jgi:polysaccharide deacetylase 2 family uncharacterized protein YibQ